MIRKFISYYRPHKNLFILDMFCAVTASVLAIIFPFITRTLLGEYLPAGNLNMIFKALSLMFAIYIAKALLTYIRVKWGHILGVRIEADMRRDLFAHIQKLSFNYFDKVKTGHLMSRISNDLNIIAEVAHHAPEDLLISTVVLIMAYSVMFVFNAQLALISLIPLPFMLIWGLIMGSRMRKGFRLVRKEIADINSTVENSVQGIREVKSFANENMENSKFHKTNTSFRMAKEIMYQKMAQFHSFMDFLREMYYFCIIAGGTLLIFQGSLALVDLLAFILYVGVVLPPIDRLINFTEQMQQGISSFERFLEVMELDPDIIDSKDAVPFQPTGAGLNIKNLSFRYEKSPDWILKNINMEIKVGETIALAGESGAGKSTIAALIPRFYELNKGEITIDGQKISSVTQESLRKSIGIVQQNVFLFDGTIRENISYGNPDATEEELQEALVMANLEEFVAGLTDGIETEVGERGVLLSGGQKQRISIARVFLKNPELLILDEATSSLDNESESLIQEALWKLSRDRTTIIIAHRLSTIMKADRIYVMKQGEIVEQGSHTELLEMNGYYKSLADKGTLVAVEE
ncbi:MULTISPECIES: ABC transporter ATP-binding protein [unclassified Oceanispirochaeta]|uniref:ABC transporter ATP-binding protein n=1 Tax=unclassified Oceanispirochaeta TaxID=2635722 RepID=UPI000E08DCC6|nr:MULTISPECIES: ABC transporter ATP-binding protein [unclassified Oceanispirochaeta]MBF9014339.1 ABC transporter ATP-binding protein [Oceanispirochaeta sp. M2]NPD71225.1 ABC transporter ATP-binding protein [Oceanispirochaeta sp. M1]RDG33611.1 ABC transporter ATP-binding protein [Oceanispirochaeta sp. M1]